MTLDEHLRSFIGLRICSERQDQDLVIHEDSIHDLRKLLYKRSHSYTLRADSQLALCVVVMEAAVCGLKDEAPATRDKCVGCVAEFQKLIELRHI